MACNRSQPAVSNHDALVVTTMRRWTVRVCIGVILASLWLSPALPVLAETASPELIDVTIPDAVPVAPTQRSAEVRGLLPHANDHHYFGLEATQPGGAFAVTLTVEPVTALENPDAVNFLVLTEDGLARFLAGANPLAVKVAMGSPLLFDQVGNRLTALVPGSVDSGYTVIVYNQSDMPVAYTLQVQGAILHDDAGQTYAASGLVAPSQGGTTSAERLLARTSPVAAMDGAAVAASAIMTQRLAAGAEVDPAAKTIYTAPGEDPAVMSVEIPGKQPPVAMPVRARRVSGTLGAVHDRHYLNLVADETTGEITLRLTTNAETAAGLANFWVMTQDGVRHLIQGVRPDEVTLATGSLGIDGVIEARFRAARHVVYTIVVFNESGVPMDYALQVSGGMVLDQYGQTREAHAAAMEMLALAN